MTLNDLKLYQIVEFGQGRYVIENISEGSPIGYPDQKWRWVDLRRVNSNNETIEGDNNVFILYGLPDKKFELSEIRTRKAYKQI